LSGRFSPLSAPLPLTPFSAHSAPFSAPLTCSACVFHPCELVRCQYLHFSSVHNVLFCTYIFRICVFQYLRFQRLQSCLGNSTQLVIGPLSWRSSYHKDGPVCPSVCLSVCAGSYCGNFYVNSESRDQVSNGRMLKNFEWPYLCNGSSDPLRVWC